MATDRIAFIDGYGKEMKDYMQTYFDVKLRFAPNEKFYQTRSNRYPNQPRCTGAHPLAQLCFKDVLGSRYSYNRTEFGIQKRFWFSAFGYFDGIVKAGKVWDKVPFPMLILPNANLSYTIQPESYALMNALEFINDQYVSWDFTYNANGALFNRIPLLKYMKLREVFSFRGLYGSLSKKNNPLYNQDLFVFPKGSTEMDKMPYMGVRCRSRQHLHHLAGRLCVAVDLPRQSQREQERCAYLVALLILTDAVPAGRQITIYSNR